MLGEFLTGELKFGSWGTSKISFEEIARGKGVVRGLDIQGRKRFHMRTLFWERTCTSKDLEDETGAQKGSRERGQRMRLLGGTGQVLTYRAIKGFMDKVMIKDMISSVVCCRIRDKTPGRM